MPDTTALIAAPIVLQTEPIATARIRPHIPRDGSLPSPPRGTEPKRHRRALP